MFRRLHRLTLVTTLGLAAVSGPAASAPPLPLILEAPRAPGDTLAVFYSGDGGWAAADRGIARELAQRGVAVVGVDSLRYFAAAPSQAEAAEDLSSIIMKFSSLWGRPKVVIAGYSFGAGAAPIIAGGLAPPVRAKVKLVALVAPLAWGSLRFSPSSWLDIAPRGARPLEPFLPALEPAPVLCIYGAADRSAACPRLHAATMRQVPISGGHHLDGDYPRIAGAIVQALG